VDFPEFVMPKRPMSVMVAKRLAGAAVIAIAAAAAAAWAAD
jgi:hypothetical protein